MTENPPFPSPVSKRCFPAGVHWQFLPGFQRVQLPIRGTGVEVISPEGDSLVVMQGAKICKEGSRGNWPERSRIVEFITLPNGRRLRLARWSWLGGKRAEEPDQRHYDRITVFPEFGGYYAWDHYGCPGEIEELIGAYAETADLDRAFTAWYDEWARLDPVDSLGSQDLVPDGGWEAWKDRGLDLCHWLHYVMGPEGLVVYRSAPARFGCGNRGLAIYWEPSTAPT